MQDRKRLEEQIAQDKEISSLAGDLDTLFELAREGEDVSADLDREMQVLRRLSRIARNQDAALRRKRRALRHRHHSSRRGRH